MSVKINIPADLKPLKTISIRTYFGYAILSNFETLAFLTVLSGFVRNQTNNASL